MSQPYERVPGSPVGWSDTLQRRMRDDDIDTLCTSSLTLAERALSRDEYAIAADLISYFHEETTHANHAVLAWLQEILAQRVRLAGLPPMTATREGESMRAAMASFDPGKGDLRAALQACGARDSYAASRRAELMLARIAITHDLVVWWTHQLLSNLAATHGEDTVLSAIWDCNDSLWSKHYQGWYAMDAAERLAISVEGMRGHLAGPLRRGGDIAIVDHGNAYRMMLDPCGVLRRGDCDTGRSGCDPAGPAVARDWTSGRTDMGWYAVHSAIVMEWLQARTGQPPLRPLHNCDRDMPCTWFVFKNATQATAAEPAMAALQHRTLAAAG